MRAIFHAEADEEFQHALETYQAGSLELGLRFYRAVFAAVARIEAHPRTWPRLRGDVRKCVVEEFPYKLLYTIEPERLHVVAVMHGKRAPDYWIERLKQEFREVQLGVAVGTEMEADGFIGESLTDVIVFAFVRHLATRGDDLHLVTALGW